jgi:hypothetical protein
MDRHLSKIAHVLAVAVVNTRAAATNVWGTTMGELAHRYRPEAHYMRGPGPKWRAKHPEAAARPWEYRTVFRRLLAGKPLLGDFHGCGLFLDDGNGLCERSRAVPLAGSCGCQSNKEREGECGSVRVRLVVFELFFAIDTLGGGAAL